PAAHGNDGRRRSRHHPLVPRARRGRIAAAHRERRERPHGQFHGHPARAPHGQHLPGPQRLHRVHARHAPAHHQRTPRRRPAPHRDSGPHHGHHGDGPEHRGARTRGGRRVRAAHG